MTTPDDGHTALGRPDWDKLLDAHTSYSAVASPSYNEVLNEIAGRIKAAGSIGKSDIGALLFWKRLWADTP